MRQADKRERSFYLEFLRAEIRCLIEVTRVLITTRKEVEKQIKEIDAEDEEEKILKSILGLTCFTASTLSSVMGNGKRFEREGFISSYCGVSPVMWQSSNLRVKIRRRKSFSRRLKGVLYYVSFCQRRIILNLGITISGRKRMKNLLAGYECSLQSVDKDHLYHAQK